MGDIIIIIFHSKKLGSNNDQTKFGHDYKHNQIYAYKILFLHHDIRGVEMNGSRSHHGSLRYPSNMSFYQISITNTSIGSSNNNSNVSFSISSS
jgi:hypothetical protein